MKKLLILIPLLVSCGNSNVTTSNKTSSSNLTISSKIFSTNEDSSSLITKDSTSSSSSIATSSSTITSTSSTISESSSSSTSSSEIKGEEYDNYLKIKKEDLRYTLRDVNENLGWHTSVSTGTQKLLIVPVQLSNGPKWTKSMLSRLNDAFFGEEGTTKFESVKSYFAKSSYGNIELTGEILEPYLFNQSIYTVDSYGTNAPKEICKAWFDTISSSKAKSFDLDADGFIDNTIFIYSNDYTPGFLSSFWAWCGPNYDNSPSFNKPRVNNYMWASYSFMNDGYNDGFNSELPSSHTYIHETGHLLGLDDYYCYDGEDKWDCAGTLEMQAQNIGDHNAYSKLASGWMDPYYVLGDCEITLNTSALNNECIIINDNWNGSPLDEYILVEYYTPNGLNKQDSLHRYASRDLMYDYNGLRIYHIDARIVKLDSDGLFVEYDDIIKDDGYNYYVGASNSYGNSFLDYEYIKKYRYVHLLDEEGNNKINNGLGIQTKLPSDGVLWSGDKVFTPTSNFFIHGDSFNDGSKIGYSIEVSDLTDTSCKVVIKKI